MKHILSLEVAFRELQPVDLDAIAWSGGAAHLRVVEQTMRESWEALMLQLVAELPNGQVVALGALDLRGEVPLLWQLGVREQWRGLGLGTAMIQELERLAIEAGYDKIALTVEDDNPMAKSLYQRLGYAVTGSVVETWPLDDSRTYACVCTRLDKSLRKGKAAGGADLAG